LLDQLHNVGAKVNHLYGLTETYGPHTMCVPQEHWKDLPPAERAQKFARQGIAYINAEAVRVVDDDMNDVPADGATMGEVVMRGNNVMKGYYNDPEATEHAFRGGWFHSGDVGVMHADGYIELRDRSKDIIISGAENISSIEVEQCIYRHDAVLEVAVIGVPHDKWGESPRAYVTLKGGVDASEQDIINFCREHIAHYKCPTSVVFCELPKTSTGKVQKYALRDEAWAGKDKKIQGA
jgi:fatty-acyl-CoA synthase